jgi:PAS domain S-box-containing protein
MTLSDQEWLLGGGDAGAQIRSMDASALGPRGSWPAWLRTALQLTLASSAPMALVVGPERVFFCNDAYRAAVPDAPPLGTWGAGPEALVSRVLAHGETCGAGALAYSPVRDEHGRVTGVLIAALRTEDERLRESTALLAAISDSSEDVIFAKDRQGRLRFANPATLALIGKRREDVLDRTDAEFLGDAEAARQVMENDRRIMEGGAATELEELVPLPDGTPRVWLSRKVPYRDPEGRVVGLLGISRDITERKLAEAALRRSEERFRSVAENMSEGLMIFDPEGNLVYQNRASLRIHGFPLGQDGRLDREEIPTTWEAWDERGRPITFEEWPVSRVFRHERFEGQVLHVRRVETGQEFNASYNGAPVYEADGRLAVGFITIRDISDEVRAQGALRESEELARASLDAAQLGTWRHDLREGTIVFDARAAEHYGVPSGRSHIDDVLRRVHPDDLGRLRAAVAETTRADGSGRYAIEYRIVRSDGSICWLAVHARIRFEGEGPHRRPVAGFGTSQDITDRKRAEETLKDANERLREADHRKNEFLAVLSHELRNPLAPIRSSVFVLERTPPGDPRATRALAVIDRQAQQLARLIDDLLDVTRIGRAKITLQRSVLDLVALARDAGEDHRDAFVKSDVELALELPAAPVWVEGDPARLAQVIGNLLSNAVKFTPRGGTTVLSLGIEGPWAIVRVRDDGVGMNAETLQHAFEPFVQAAQTIDRTRGGLGLGLALVKGLVELHDGSVEASSAGEGQGAELTVRLPLAAAIPISSERPPASKPAARGLRVLIVEDNVDAAHSLREALELAGHEVVAVAHDGAAGVRAAREHGPDVVLCDLGLPGLDGFDVARALRAADDPRLRSAFLVAVSGYALAEDRSKAKRAGFDRHLAKPASLERLQTLLSEIPRAG